MIRISTATEEKAITITVDGRLTAEYIEALDTCVKQAAKYCRQVHIYLRDVSTIDEQGRALLSRVAADGVQLSAAGIYSSYIVSQIKPSAKRVTPCGLSI